MGQAHDEQREEERPCAGDRERPARGGERGAGARQDRRASREDSRRQSRVRRLRGVLIICVTSATRRGRQRPGLPRRRQGDAPPLPSSRTPQCFGVIFPAKVWVTIFPSFTTKVSVPIS